MAKMCTSLAVAALFACLAAALPARAQTASRAWVSGKGTDAPGCGAPTSPCRSLQYAHDDIVAARGEIDILDPAGYGAITITKALSIVNDGVGTAGVQSTSNYAIRVNIGANDAVYLRGLTIEGQGGALFGIFSNSGGWLTISDCVVRGFSNAGIELEPTLGFPVVLVSNTVSSDNGSSGIEFAPPGGGSAAAQLAIDRSTFNDDLSGIFATNTPGHGSLALSVSNTIVSNSHVSGIELNNVAASIDNSISELNNGDGILVSGSASTVVLSRSMMTQNVKYGVENNITTPSVTYTTGDNRLVLNQLGDAFGVALIPNAPE